MCSADECSDDPGFGEERDDVFVSLQWSVHLPIGIYWVSVDVSFGVGSLVFFVFLESLQ